MEREKSPMELILNYLIKNGGIALQIGRRFVFGDYGLSEPKFEMLQLLSESNQSLRLSELSERMSVTNANITGLVDRLERDSFVIRKRDPLDRRATLAVLTPKGHELYQQVLFRYTSTLKNLFGEISEDEQDHFLQTLQKIHYYLRDISSEGVGVPK